MSGSTNDFSVASFASLSADIETINAETIAGIYTIDITGDISLTGALPKISLASGVTLDLVGNGHTLNGGGADPGLFAYQGTVSIDDLTLLNNTITGGAGTGGGGGGAGLGGGLFVGSKAAVTLDSVNFTDDGAVGGNGGANNQTHGYGAGGTGRLGNGGGAATQTSQQGGTGGFGGGGGGGGPGAEHLLILRTTFHGAHSQQGSTGGPGGGGGSGGFGGGAGGTGGKGQTQVFVSEQTGISHSHVHQLGSSKTSITYTYQTGHHYNNYTSGAVPKGGSGGGGLGAGGDIFVQGGGRLTILGGTLGAGTVKGGAGANMGGAYGGGLFLQGNEEVTLAPAAGETLAIAGVIADEAGSEPGYSADQGTIGIDGAGVVALDASDTFDGGVIITAGTVVLGAAGAAGGGDITFANNLGVDPNLAFTVADAPNEAIVDFGMGDVLDVTDLSAASVVQSFVANDTGGGTLTLTGTQIGSGAPATVNLVFTDYQGPFDLTADAGGGTDIAICYVRGTNILTPAGNVPVETLRIGDPLVTRFGGIRPVKWIGRQSYDVRFLANSPAKRPVRIRAGALAPGMPARDLLVSPGHSLLLGDTLVLASVLVNGVTIVYEPLSAQTGTLDYYQIEFASHDCVIAEGAWAESYADAPGLRAQFHNAAEFSARYPDEAPPEDLTLCAARPERGGKLEAALRPAAARAAAAVIPGPLVGFIDTADAWRIDGWALDTAHPDLPVLLDILLDDEALGDALAWQPREDLRAAGKGSGRCAFSFTAPRRLPADALSRMTVRRTSDSAPLPLSFEAACRPAAATPTGLRIVA